MTAKVKPEEGVAETVIENEVAPAEKTVALKSPWGSKVNVAADQADLYRDAGYTASK